LGWNAVNEPDGVANHTVMSIAGSSGVVLEVPAVIP
jgi:hypothetical protein